MEGLRSTSAANWVMVAGGGGARCGAARRVLHFRAPIGGAQHGGAFSRVLIWRRATAVAPAFPRPPSPFSAFPSPEKQEEVKTDKDASSVETQTASDPPAAAAAATEQSAEAVLQPQAPTEPLKAASSESQETSEADEAETDAARETPPPGESQETSESETVVVAETDAQNDDPRKVRVRFMLQKSCRFGEQFLLVGEHQALGSWNPDNAIPMEWSDGHVWVTDDVELPVGEEIKYKFILRPLSGKIKWQPGEDKVLQTCESADAAIVVTGDWESPDDEKTTEKEKASDDVAAAGSDGADATESKQEAEEVVHEDLKSTAVEAGDQEKRVVHEGEPVLVPGFATVAASAAEA